MTPASRRPGHDADIHRYLSRVGGPPAEGTRRLRGASCNAQNPSLIQSAIRRGGREKAGQAARSITVAKLASDAQHLRLILDLPARHRDADKARPDFSMDYGPTALWELRHADLEWPDSADVRDVSVVAET